MLIYKVTNKVNGDFYIGMTSDPTIDRRRRNHRGSARGGHQNHFYRAIRKYGWENFDWLVIDRASSVEELRNLEQKYIAELNPRYNMTDGGDGITGYQFTPEVRAKIGASSRGRKHSEETKRIIREKTKRHQMTPEQKARQIQRIKEYWAERKNVHLARI